MLADAEMEPGALRPAASDDALCCGDAPSLPRAAADTRWTATSYGESAPKPSVPGCSSRSSSDPASQAQRLSPGDVGAQLLANSLATGAGLVALILAIGPISGAHLNPLVTLADRLLGGTTTRDALGVRSRADDRRVRRCDRRESHVRSARDRALDRCALVGWGLAGRVVATFGLLVVILGVGEERPVPCGRLRGRRLHRGCVLVHVVDELRESGGDRRLAR